MVSKGSSIYIFSITYILSLSWQIDCCASWKLTVVQGFDNLRSQSVAPPQWTMRNKEDRWRISITIPSPCILLLHVTSVFKAVYPIYLLQEPPADVHPQHVQRALGKHPQSRRHGRRRDGYLGKGIMSLA